MTDSEAFGNLGVAYYYLERYDDAVREVLQAVVLSPEEINWRLNLGAIYTRRDDHEGAARAYGAAVDIARDLPDENRHQLRNALLGLGRSCEMVGWYDRALEAYEEALVFGPEDTELLTGAGNVYFRLGRLDEAEASYQRTLARDSTHTVARYNVALIYARTGRYEEALELFEDNPAVDRQLEGALEGSTVSAVDRSKTRSITAYRAMLERMGGTPPPVARQGRRPNRPLPYIHVMGVTYYEQGAYFEAMQAFEKGAGGKTRGLRTLICISAISTPGRIAMRRRSMPMKKRWTPTRNSPRPITTWAACMPTWTGPKTPWRHIGRRSRSTIDSMTPGPTSGCCTQRPGDWMTRSTSTCRSSGPM